MIRYNKYLKDVGIKKNDYPFDEIKPSFSENKCLRIATWNCNWALVLTIYSHLKAFREYNNGYPIGMNEEDFNAMLDEMIEGFAFYIKTPYCSEDFKEAEKKLKKSMKMLADNFEELWW